MRAADEHIQSNDAQKRYDERNPCRQQNNPDTVSHPVGNTNNPHQDGSLCTSRMSHGKNPSHRRNPM
jgi:hypothetical protein